jgi:hypothetical protein
MRLARVWIAIPLAAGALCAQPASISAQETDRARQLLGSAQWVDRAWGVYLAGRLHADDLNQLLIEQFREAAAFRNAASYADEHAFLAVLFDAAIEAGVTVPAALLEPFEESWAPTVLILLARDKDSEDALLRFGADKSRDMVWLAANNLLCERKSQAWYEANLAQIGVTNKFTVSDPGSGGFGGGSGGSVYVDGIAALPKGFPPAALYTLTDYPSNGDALLARGPTSVYYRRTVVPTNKQVGRGSSGSVSDRNAVRVGYVAQLGFKRAEDTNRLFHRETQITYSSLENFQRQVEQSLQAQEQGIRELLATIEKQGLHASGIHLQIVRK